MKTQTCANCGSVKGLHPIVMGCQKFKHSNHSPKVNVTRGKGIPPKDTPEDEKVALFHNKNTCDSSGNHSQRKQTGAPETTPHKRFASSGTLRGCANCGKLKELLNKQIKAFNELKPSNHSPQRSKLQTQNVSAQKGKLNASEGTPEDKANIKVGRSDSIDSSGTLLGCGKWSDDMISPCGTFIQCNSCKKPTLKGILCSKHKGADNKRGKNGL